MPVISAETLHSAPASSRRLRNTTGAWRRDDRNSQDEKTQTLCITTKPESPPGWEGRSPCSRLCSSVAERRKAGKASPQLSGLPCRRAKNKGEDGSRAAGLGREGGPGRFGKPRPGVGTACPRKKRGVHKGGTLPPLKRESFQRSAVCFRNAKYAFAALLRRVRKGKIILYGISFYPHECFHSRGTPYKHKKA